MADVQFWFGGGFYGDAPVYDAASEAQETVTSAASAVHTTAVSQAAEPVYARRQLLDLARSMSL